MLWVIRFSSNQNKKINGAIIWNGLWPLGRIDTSLIQKSTILNKIFGEFYEDYINFLHFLIFWLDSTRTTPFVKILQVFFCPFWMKHKSFLASFFRHILSKLVDAHRCTSKNILHAGETEFPFWQMRMAWWVY